MRLRIVIAICLGSSAAHAEDITTDRASQPDEPGEVRPSMLAPAARLPGRTERATVSVAGGGAASRAVGSAEAMVALVPRLALGVGLGDDGIGALTSTFTGAVQIVHGRVDLAGRVRYRTLGPEDAGGQIAGQLVLGASTRVVGFTMSALVGRGVGARNDVDAEGTAMAFVRPIRWLRIGAEGRARGELAETLVFATAMHTSVLGAIVTLAPRLLYPLHAVRAAPYGIDAQSDQELAGIVMWVPSGVVLTLAALALFACWLAEAGRRAAIAERRRSASVLQ